MTHWSEMMGWGATGSLANAGAARRRKRRAVAKVFMVTSWGWRVAGGEEKRKTARGGLDSGTAANVYYPFRCGPADEPQGLKPRRGGLDYLLADIALSAIRTRLLGPTLFFSRYRHSVIITNKIVGTVTSDTTGNTHATGMLASLVKSL